MLLAKRKGGLDCSLYAEGALPSVKFLPQHSMASYTKGSSVFLKSVEP